jgi:hypothetical protein
VTRSAHTCACGICVYVLPLPRHHSICAYLHSLSFFWYVGQYACPSYFHFGLLGCLEPTSELYERYTAAQTLPKLAKARHIHVYSGSNLKIEGSPLQNPPTVPQQPKNTLKQKTLCVRRRERSCAVLARSRPRIGPRPERSAGPLCRQHLDAGEVIKLPSSAPALARNSRLCGQRSPCRKTLHAARTARSPRRAGCTMYSRTHAGCSMQSFLGTCFQSLSTLSLSAWLLL